MTDSLKQPLVDKPELPEVNFDWTCENWEDIGQRLLKATIACSTEWQSRRPSPVENASAISAKFEGSLHQDPVDIEHLTSQLMNDVFPCSAFNGHPRWFAYITSSPTPMGVLSDMIASALNQNTALWRIAPAATAIELQTIDWIKEMLGYPSDAEGIFVSGGQFANIVAQSVIRDYKATWDVRRHGVAGGANHSVSVLRIYASEEIHYCHQQAAELLGMGRTALQLVPTNSAYQMCPDSLIQMIAEDRARGFLPIAIVATAGTVGTGAIDPLERLLKIAQAENLWFHIDGAYGAFAAIAPSAPKSLKFLSEADSVACDPHKWLFAPIDAGVVLIRQKGLLEKSFSFHAAYLESQADSSGVDMLERSPENTRPFRAFKVWLMLQYYGLNSYRDIIERNLRLAAYLEDLVKVTPGLSLAAPRELSIVCWRVEPEGVTDNELLNPLQSEVISEMERRGIAVISNAKLKNGNTALRACIVNFRTAPEDVETIVKASIEIGAELVQVTK